MERRNRELENASELREVGLQRRQKKLKKEWNARG